MKNEYSQYVLPLSILVALVFMGLLYLLVKYKKELKAKDEKIKSLHQANEQSEKRHEEKAQEAQSKIVALTHEVNTLQREASEGTKNQVVTKIEAQQNRRARELKRAGLEEA
ncbi:MAG: hypothetical protein L3J43_08140 [Sulfurovum sp.]|nr:hypothetical protein [Sulfurovum sp.]